MHPNFGEFAPDRSNWQANVYMALGSTRIFLRVRCKMCGSLLRKGTGAESHQQREIVPAFPRELLTLATRTTLWTAPFRGGAASN